MTKIAQLIWLCALISCVTTPNDLQDFRFPESFSALQVIEIQHGSDHDTVLASLKRTSARSYDVVFLHGLTQRPLLRLIYQEGSTMVEKLTEGLPEAIRPESILDSIRALYDAQAFQGEGAGLVFESHGMRYELSDFLKEQDCKFPGRIVLKSQDAKVNFSLSIKTENVLC